MITSFLHYRFPNETEIHHLDFTEKMDNDIVFEKARIEPWIGNNAEFFDISKASVPHDDYVRNISELVNLLRQRQGKTVIQRTISGKFSNFSPFEMEKQYFERFPDMFCFLFYHPSCGWWMGASPELLLHSSDLKKFETRALAGTRLRNDASGKWSDKNIEEHQFVIDDITAYLSRLDSRIRVEQGDRYNFSYDSIEHLCTPLSITGVGGPEAFGKIAGAIHPTAAVCGLPRDMAVEEISHFETTPRKYYSGLITVPGPEADGKTAYVILRCVHFDDKFWCVYTGSGITESSDPEDEWNETAHKASPLIEILSRF